MKIRSRDGRWTVEAVSFPDTGQWLAVKDYGFYAGRVRTPEELAKFGIDMKECEEVS